MTRVSEFKIKNFFCLFWRGELESVNFFSQTTNNPNKKKKKKFFFWGGAGVGGGGGWLVGVLDGWTVQQAQTNLPLQLLRSWGHNKALMYKLFS